MPRGVVTSVCGPALAVRDDPGSGNEVNRMTLEGTRAGVEGLRVWFHRIASPPGAMAPSRLPRELLLREELRRA